MPLRFHATLFLLGLGSIAVGCQGARSTAAAATARPETKSAAAAAPARIGTDPGHASRGTPLVAAGRDQLAAFAAGCFWGVEDAFRHVPGVVATAVGYAGGHTADPTYEKVCSHNTGHAETVLVEYDPTRVPYEQLLRVFFKIHDPTQIDGQGPDFGDQYRSAIFTFSDEQQAAARAAIEAQQQVSDRVIATQVAGWACSTRLRIITSNTPRGPAATPARSAPSSRACKPDHVPITKLTLVVPLPPMFSVWKVLAPST